jgi:hypothetical protein
LMNVKLVAPSILVSSVSITLPTVVAVSAAIEHSLSLSLALALALAHALSLSLARSRARALSLPFFRSPLSATSGEDGAGAGMRVQILAPVAAVLPPSRPGGGMMDSVPVSGPERPNPPAGPGLPAVTHARGW